MWRGHSLHILCVYLRMAHGARQVPHVRAHPAYDAGVHTVLRMRPPRLNAPETVVRQPAGDRATDQIGSLTDVDADGTVDSAARSASTVMAPSPLASLALATPLSAADDAPRQPSAP